MQFGPIILIPDLEPILATSSSSFLFPTSLNPDDIIIAAFTPVSPASCITLGTASAGTAITIISTSF